MKSKTLIVLLLAVACNPHKPEAGVPTPEVVLPKEAEKSGINTSSKLVGAMHDTYSGKWYKTLSFQQTNSFFTSAGKEQKSEWLQRLSVPGRMRIDFLPLSSKSGLLIQNNRVITFDNGKRVDSRRAIQPVLTLTGDVYAIPATITLRRLDSLGVDLNKFHEEKWQGKRVYVMGAERGDLALTQIWIDAERLLLMRFIQREKRGERTVTTDTQVGDYRDIDGFAVAHEFSSFRDGKPFFTEKYENVKVNQPIAAAFFDATRWASVQAAMQP